MEKEICAAVLIVFAIFSCVVHGCSEFDAGVRDPASMEEDNRKIYYSEVVVYGEIIRNVTGDYPHKGIAGVVTVEFNVICTYLGGPVPSTIFIAGVGNDKQQLPHCPPVLNEKRRPVIMFLKRTDNSEVFEAEFKPNYGDPSLILDDLSINCGLELPAGSAALCRDYAPLSKKDECITYSPPTTTQAPTTVPTKKEPVVVDDPNEKGNQKDEGYETKDNPDASKTKENPDKMSGSGDPANGVIIPTGSLLACLSAWFLVLFTVL